MVSLLVISNLLSSLDPAPHPHLGTASLTEMVAEASLETRLATHVATRPARRFWEWLMPEMSHCPGHINEILVTGEGLWLGSNIGACIHLEKTGETHDWARVPALLAELPASSTSSVQVAFADGALFADWMQAADAVRRAGLDVRYASKDMLDLRFDE